MELLLPQFFLANSYKPQTLMSGKEENGEFKGALKSRSLFLFFRYKYAPALEMS